MGSELAVKGKVKLQAVLDYVIIERLPEVEENDEPGLIITPATAREENPLARVVSIGPGSQRPDGTYPNPPCDIGDTVILSKFIGTIVRRDWDEEGERKIDHLLIVKWGDIQAVVTKLD